MKKVFFALLLTVFSLPALAQHYPYPTNCTVVASDRFNRFIAYFWSYTDSRTGMCRDALRSYNLEIRRRGWYDARC